jgi:hypothetical protein
MTEKDYTYWTRKEFEELPWRKSFHSDEGELDAIVLIPTRRMHDSGFRVIQCVAIKDGKPTVKLTGCSDVIHIGGLSAMLKPARNYNIDCMKTSGLFRIFAFDGKLRAGAALSSFDII